MPIFFMLVTLLETFFFRLLIINILLFVVIRHRNDSYGYYLLRTGIFEQNYIYVQARL